MNMGYQIKTKLELNDIPFKRWDSITLKQSLNTLAGITINMPNPVGLYTNLPFEDMPIKFYLGYDTDTPPLRFDGYMDNPKFAIQKNGATISMDGIDFGKILFEQLTVDNSFKSFGNPITKGYILDYIRYINQHISSPLPELFERNLVDDNKSSFAYLFEYEKCLEAIKTLCSYGNYNWQMLLDQNNNRQFSVRAPKSLIASNVTHAFIVGGKENYTDIPSGATIHNVSSLSVQKDYGFKKNYIKVIGNTAGNNDLGVEAVYPLSPPSNPKHLLYNDTGIWTNDDARVIAKRLYDSKTSPKILVDFGGIGVETLRVGDIIYANDYRYGLSTLPTHIFRLIEINDTISFGSGWNSTFKVADFAPTLFQFFDDSIDL